MMRLRLSPQPQRPLKEDAYDVDTPPRRRRRRRPPPWSYRTLVGMASTLGIVGSILLLWRRDSTVVSMDQVPPLLPIDYKYFTLRINTWQREDQLQLSIQHHLSCPSVLQIQVIWCIDQANDIPDWLLRLEEDDHSLQDAVPRVVIERHTINSLNERFHILVPIPTAAVLSVDDDVLRPCLALDHTFQKWFRNPDRQVGFDARSHEVVYIDPVSGQEHHHRHDPSWTERWKYAYMSVTEKTNLYSLTLTRYSFLHQYYLTSYMTQMPQEIRDSVAKHFNCEDIAMSLWVSSHTQGQPPLLADYWAVKSQIKLYVPKKISGSSNHKSLRDDCVHDFSRRLGLPERHFATAPLHLGGHFDYGAVADDWNDEHVPPVSEWPAWHQEAATTVRRWKSLEQSEWMKELRELHEVAIAPMIHAGFIEKTPQWRERFPPEKKSRHDSDPE